MKIVADDKIPYLRGLLEPVAQEVMYVPGSDTTGDMIKDAQVLLTRTRTRCNRELLAGSRVEMIGTATIGTDHIDLDYCRDNGIEVASAPGCNAPAVAQWVHASILRWLEARHVSRRITLGVVGVGHVGSIVARWGHELGYRVLLNDPPLCNKIAMGQALQPQCTSDVPLAFSSLSTLQRECDIITFHTPLTHDGPYPTYHLVDKSFLAGLERCRLIMNAARGAVLDTTAALQWHGDLAIDCWEKEPDINLNLLEKAIVATPHIAGYSVQGKQRGTAMIIEALNRRYGWDVEPPAASTPLLGAAHVSPSMILESYDPCVDTLNLKSSPSTFETQRNTYNLRQEVCP